MKKTTAFLLTAIFILPASFIFADDSSSNTDVSSTNSQMPQPPNMPTPGQMPTPPQMQPPSMPMMGGSSPKTVVATSDGGIVIVEGNKITKLDSNLEVTKSIELSDPDSSSDSQASK